MTARLLEYSVIAPETGRGAGCGGQPPAARRANDDLFRMLCFAAGDGGYEINRLAPDPREYFRFAAANALFDRNTIYRRLELRCGATPVVDVWAPVISISGPPQDEQWRGETAIVPQKAKWPAIDDRNAGALVRFRTAADRVIEAYERGREDDISGIVVRPGWFRCFRYSGGNPHYPRLSYMDAWQSVAHLVDYRDGKWGMK